MPLCAIDKTILDRPAVLMMEPALVNSNPWYARKKKRCDDQLNQRININIGLWQQTNRGPARATSEMHSFLSAFS